MREHGALSVTWLSPEAPWASHRVVVDGVEVGRVGYRRSAYLPLVAGRHEVVLRSRKPGYSSETVQIDIEGNGRVDLFCGRRELPSGIRDHNEIVAWSKESSIWLGFARSAPPIVESQPARPGRFLSVWVAVVLFWLLTGGIAVAHGRWVSAALSVGFLTLGLNMVQRDLAARFRPRQRVDSLR